MRDSSRTKYQAKSLHLYSDHDEATVVYVFYLLSYADVLPIFFNEFGDGECNFYQQRAKALEQLRDACVLLKLNSSKTILVLSSLTFVKAFFLDFSILTLYFIWWRREEAWIKEQGQSAWTVFRSQVRGWEMPCFLEGEKRTRPLQRITASVNIPGHSWFWFWRPNIWTVIFFSLSKASPFHIGGRHNMLPDRYNGVRCPELPLHKIYPYMILFPQKSKKEVETRKRREWGGKCSSGILIFLLIWYTNYIYVIHAVIHLPL